MDDQRLASASLPGSSDCSYSSQSGVSRRAFLRLTAGGAIVGAVGLPLLLNACGSSATVAASSSGVVPGAAGPKSLVMPAYLPFQGPKPDLPASDGIDAGYFSFPKDLIKAVPEPPGKGGNLTMFAYTTLTAPPPMDQNAMWQELNKQLGLTLNLNVVSSADYLVKVSTLMAGGDLPDTVYVNQNATAAVSNLPEFLKATCADLTPYLSGDAIKDYPNLSHFPTPSWKAAIYNNSLYGVPVPRPAYVTAMIVRQDFMDQVGGVPAKNSDDFKKLLQSLTRPQAKEWASHYTSSC